MSLFLHICAGLGLALAAGIRPFTPAWVAGALASGRVGFDFRGTHFAYLQSPLFLIALVVVFVGSLFVRSRGVDELILCGSIALGGLLCAAMFSAHGQPAWPGLIGGALAAAIAAAATRPVLLGAAARLDDRRARAAVPLYADAAALVLALVCWFAGPVALVALVLLGRLAWVSRAATLRSLGVWVLR